MENKKYNKCYVAFLDILGFKNFVNNNGFEKVFDAFNIIYDLSSLFTNDCGIKKKYNACNCVSFNIISDSVVYSIPVTEPDALKSLLYVVNTVVFQLFAQKGLLCRGGVSVGDFYSDQNIAFGPALVKAYELECQYAIYPRILIDESTLSLSISPGIIQECLDEKLIMFDKDNYYCSDYLSFSLYKFSISDNAKMNFALCIMLEESKTLIEQALNSTISKHIFDKLDYFVNYYNHSLHQYYNNNKLYICFSNQKSSERWDHMNTIDLNLVIERINELCKKNSITINQMLKNCSAGTSLVDNMKKGSYPSVDKLKKVADYFGIALEYLIGEVTEQEMQHAKKYAVLDDTGKDNVDKSLEVEYRRCTEKTEIACTPLPWAIPSIEESKAIASADVDTHSLEEPPADESMFENVPKNDV